MNQDEFKEKRKQKIEDIFLDERTIDLLNRSINYTISTGNEAGFFIYPFGGIEVYSELIEGDRKSCPISQTMLKEETSYATCTAHTHPPIKTKKIDTSEDFETWLDNLDSEDLWDVFNKLNACTNLDLSIQDLLCLVYSFDYYQDLKRSYDLMLPDPDYEEEFTFHKETTINPFDIKINPFNSHRADLCIYQFFSQPKPEDIEEIIQFLDNYEVKSRLEWITKRAGYQDTKDKLLDHMRLLVPISYDSRDKKPYINEELDEAIELLAETEINQEK